MRITSGAFFTFFRPQRDMTTELWDNGQLLTQNFFPVTDSWKNLLGVSCIYVTVAHLSLRPPLHMPRGMIWRRFSLKSGSSPLEAVAKLVTFNPLKRGGGRKRRVRGDESRGGRDGKHNNCGEKCSPGHTEDVECVTLQQSSAKHCQRMPGKS